MTNEEALTQALQNSRYSFFPKHHCYLLSLKGCQCCLGASHQCRNPPSQTSWQLLCFAASSLAHIRDSAKERQHGKNFPLFVFETLVAQWRPSRHPTKGRISLLLELLCFLAKPMAFVPPPFFISICFCSPISHTKLKRRRFIFEVFST